MNEQHDKQRGGRRVDPKDRERSHPCIYAHKPDITKYKIGDIWECPTCHRQWERIDEPKGTFRAVWASHGV